MDCQLSLPPHWQCEGREDDKETRIKREGEMKIEDN